MIIPSPRFERIPYDLHGMSRLDQLRHRWTHSPQYRMIGDSVITMDDGLEIVNPDGFIYDGASVPRLLWPLIEPTGNLLEGAGPHDQYYQYGYLLARRMPGMVFSIESERLVASHPRFSELDLVPVFMGRGQKFGDDLLRHITIEKHGATLDADQAYWALRIFGHIAWNKYRTIGPTAFNTNSLGLPGITLTGVAY